MLKFLIGAFKTCTLMVVLTSVSTLTGMAAAEEKPVWVVEQQNRYVGRTTLYIGDDVVKFVGQGGQIELVAHAPSWDVVADRPKDKIGFRQTFSKFKESGLTIWKGHRALEHAQRKSVYDPKLKLECYEMRGPANRRSFDGNDPMIFKHTQKVSEKEMEYRCTKSLPLSVDARRFLAALYRQEDAPGIPIEMLIYLSDGSINTEFATTALYQKKMPGSFFAKAKNFKVVASNSSEMWLSKASQKEFSSLLQDVMLEEHDGK